MSCPAKEKKKAELVSSSSSSSSFVRFNQTQFIEGRTEAGTLIPGDRTSSPRPVALQLFFMQFLAIAAAFPAFLKVSFFISFLLSPEAEGM